MSQPVSELLLNKIQKLINILQPPWGLETDPPSQQSVLCPEIYTKPNASQGLLQGHYDTLECPWGKSISNLVTVIIEGVYVSRKVVSSVNQIMAEIDKTYPNIPILVSYAYRKIQPENTTNVKYIRKSSFEKKYDVLNKMLEMVKTEYVFIARDLTHFTNFSHIERLVRLVSSIPSVAAAGGGIRNRTGHWRPGCIQSSMRNYQLKMKYGYELSINECMFCDIIESSFVIRTNVTREIKFSQINPEMLFIDYFLRIKESGRISASCPDIMFFHDVSIPLQEEKKLMWRNIAKTWSINEVLLDDDVKHTFTCVQLGIRCFRNITMHYMLPLCCLHQYAKGMKYMTDIMEDSGVHYEMESGTMLGAVKFNNFLPWDIDGDVRFYASDIFKLENVQDLLNQNGFKFLDIRYACPSAVGCFSFDTGDINIDVYAQYVKTSSILPDDIKDISTRVKFHGNWYKSQVNPGLYVRNRYGPGCLKHAQSWRYTGLRTMHSQYKAGIFTSCPNPAFHSCLENFPPDGNLDFYYE